MRNWKLVAGSQAFIKVYVGGPSSIFKMIYIQCVFGKLLLLSSVDTINREKGK